MIMQGSGLPGLDHAEAIAKLETDGTVILNSGGADLGTGLDTVSAKIVAEVLKLPMDRITVVSGDTDSFGVDLFTAQEIVKSADGIINTPGADVVSGKEHTAAQQIVFSHGVERFFIGILTSFALSDGIDTEDNATFAAEGDHNSLIGVAEFSFKSMSAEEDHTGDLAFTFFGDIQIGTDREVGTAVIDHILNDEILLFNTSGDADVEVAFFSGEVISSGNAGTDFGDEFFCIFSSLEGIDLSFALSIVGTELFNVIFLNQITVVGHFQFPLSVYYP
jgi:hypothetical protein